MLVHAVVIGAVGASCAMRLHSIELDRHSVAESMDHTVCLILCQVHSFYKRCHSKQLTEGLLFLNPL